MIVSYHSQKTDETDDRNEFFFPSYYNDRYFVMFKHFSPQQKTLFHRIIEKSARALSTKKNYCGHEL